jgi:class 3 adenylate cyclase
MSVEAWVGLIAAGITLAGLVATGTTYLNRRIADLRLENRERQLTDASKRDRTDLERHLAEQMATAQRLASDLEAEREQLKALLSGRSGVVLKVQVDERLSTTMRLSGATAASVYIPAPPPNDEARFAFLSTKGPAASKIRKRLVHRDRGIAAEVMRTGRPQNTVNAKDVSCWNPDVDASTGFDSETMLTWPITLPDAAQPVAVCQFLNKKGGQPFSPQDETLVERFARRVAPLVQEFLDDEDNYEVLGIHTSRSYREAAVMFCDLTASTDLLTSMGPGVAVQHIDEYLDRLGEAALARGAKLVSVLGDGMLLSFNVPKPIPDYVGSAVAAAWSMQQEFRQLVRGWQPAEEFAHVRSRISIAVGPVVVENVGPKQFSQETVIGSAVNRANRLCRLAPRDTDVVVVDEDVARRATSWKFELIEADSGQEPKLHRLVGPA